MVGELCVGDTRWIAKVSCEQRDNGSHRMKICRNWSRFQSTVERKTNGTNGVSWWQVTWLCCLRTFQRCWQVQKKPRRAQTRENENQRHSHGRWCDSGQEVFHVLVMNVQTWRHIGDDVCFENAKAAAFKPWFCHVEKIFGNMTGQNLRISIANQFFSTMSRIVLFSCWTRCSEVILLVTSRKHRALFLRPWPTNANMFANVINQLLRDACFVSWHFLNIAGVFTNFWGHFMCACWRSNSATPNSDTCLSVCFPSLD